MIFILRPKLAGLVIILPDLLTQDRFTIEVMFLRCNAQAG